MPSFATEEEALVGVVYSSVSRSRVPIQVAMSSERNATRVFIGGECNRPNNPKTPGCFVSVTFSPDGKWIVSESRDKSNIGILRLQINFW